MPLASCRVWIPFPQSGGSRSVNSNSMDAFLNDQKNSVCFVPWQRYHSSLRIPFSEQMGRALAFGSTVWRLLLGRCWARNWELICDIFSSPWIGCRALTSFSTSLFVYRNSSITLRCKLAHETRYFRFRFDIASPGGKIFIHAHVWVALHEELMSLTRQSGAHHF